MAHIAGTHAATTAAAAAAKRNREEEEELTKYTPDELSEDWEFKIVRSLGTPFRNPVTLQNLIEDEAEAGWALVEKFDDSRVRFKRPANAREQDHLLPPDIDPYRTQYGVSEGVVGLAVIGVAVLIIVIILLVVSLGFGIGS
jgi:hypothetical protein